jgi:hypothetical protein
VADRSIHETGFAALANRMMLKECTTEHWFQGSGQKKGAYFTNSQDGVGDFNLYLDIDFSVCRFDQAMNEPWEPLKWSGISP